jgi:hypothetical protein
MQSHPLPECVSKGPRYPTETKANPREQTGTKSVKPIAKVTVPERSATKSDEPTKAPPAPTGSAIRWSQTPASELLLIWSGHLDGEVGRIVSTDFEKAVRDHQATLPAGASTEGQQIAILEKRVLGIRNRWRFETESDPQAAELSLPHVLLPGRQELSFGSLYQSSARDFVVDVAEMSTAETTFDKVRRNHCCKAPRELESQIVDTSDAAGPGFILSAREGQRRVSVRAQQRDGVIRILAIAYDMDRDKEFRVLRNAIASSYVAFEPLRKRGEARVYDSCQRSDGEGCGAEKPPTRPALWDNKQGPL